MDMKYTELYAVVCEYISLNVDERYTYHNIDHTQSVVESAIRFAGAEGLDQRSTMIVATAALLHDIGYVQGSEDHEERSCSWAIQNLPAFGYDDPAIEIICGIIRSTKVKQSPTDLMSSIVCDADLAGLGSQDYDSIGKRMRDEYRHTKPELNDAAWLDQQIRFLGEHSYFTQSAQNELQAQKELNLVALREQRAKSGIRSVNDDSQSLPHSTGESMKEHIKDGLLAVIGVIMASIALKDFLVPNHFFDGGVTGLSLLVHELYHWSLGLLIIVFNVPLIIAAYFSAGKRFALGMLLGVVLLGISLEVMPSFPATGDKLLVSVFGGAFLGIGIGLAMRAGAALDGIEVLALYTLRRTSFTIAEIILGINIVIFAIAAFTFGPETAMYSVLTYFTATRCIDYVVEGLEAFTGVTIISAHSEHIKHELVNNLGRGITVFKGERGFLPGSFHVSSECDIIFTVITRLELHKLKTLIAVVDPNAFVFASAIKDASGGILARRRKH